MVHVAIAMYVAMHMQLLTSTLLKLLCCFSTQISHIWYPLSVFLRFLCDMVPNMTYLLLKQHSSFNSVVM